MQTLVKVENKKWGFTFKTFYGKDRKEKAQYFISVMAKRGIKCVLL